MEPRPLNTKIVYVAHLPEYCPGLQVTAKCLSFSLVLGVYVSLLVSLLAHISCLTDVIELIENCNILTCHKICQFFNLLNLEMIVKASQNYDIWS